MAEQVQVEWVERVLGLKVPSGETAAMAPKQLPPLLPIWRDAKEEVDAEISRLQDALRAKENEDLQVIVDFGLHGVTKGENTRLMAALLDVDKEATPAALAKAADAVDEFKAFLASAPIVPLLERNPFGVAVPMRKTLGAALTEIEQQIGS